MDGLAPLVIGFTLCSMLSGCTALEAGSERFRDAGAGGSQLVNAGGNAGAAGTSSAGGASANGLGGAAGKAGNGIGGSAGATGCPDLESRREVVVGTPGSDYAIAEDTRWDCQEAIVLQGNVLVEDGVTLRIEPGTIVRAQPGALLLLRRGARLEASGTADAPIVFTSALAPGSRRPGDWRGVVLIGKAPTHANNVPVYNTTDDFRAHYGGGPDGDPGWSCGELRFTRVEFAGGNLDEAGVPGAALTLAGCGNGTVVDHVQVHRATDGVGLSGGSAALRHVVVTGNARGDCVEWTGGYTGTLQFIIAQSLGAGTALSGGNSQAAPGAQPVSNPRIYNATLVGTPPLVSGSHYGFVLQFGSRGTLKNSIVSGFDDAGFDLRLPADVLAGELGPGKPVDVSHVLLHGNRVDYTQAATVLDDMSTMRSRDPGLDQAGSLDAPKFSPLDSTVSVEVANPPQPFDTTAGFRGAVPFEGPDWTLGWTAYPPN